MQRFLVHLLDLIYSHARGKTVIFLLVPTLAVYTLMLVWSIPTLVNFSGGLKTFDILPLGYSSEYARTLLDALGGEGRSFYLTRQIPLDTIYPGLFAVTYSLLLAWLFKWGFGPNLRWRWFVLIPVLAGLFDYLENAGIVLMLSIYPRFSTAAAGITDAFSLLKSLFTTLFFLSLGVGLVAVIVGRKRNRSVI